MPIPYSHHQVREAFLKFFEGHDHRRIQSSSLIPQNDPTLLFTNAGMNQFKKYFVGEEKPEHPRATTSQKCVRAGGKHNDLENVGYTARHHTFFEMLGNFSFGDYFKKEAIAFGWDFVTNVLGLPKDRLIVTVFKGEEGIAADDEAAALWAAQGVPKERIVRLGMKDNFWAMGDTGPCGPCSEIHYYQGDLAADAAIKIFDTPAAEDQWVEIWNLVFMQFNRDNKGNYHPLPAPSVDTGAGLERLCAVVQGRANGKVFSNYDSDLFTPILAAIGKKLGVAYGKSHETDIAMRVIADHSRAATFLISDGVLPDNEGRGYVLRRIMRRAIRYGKKLGANKPFLAEICRAVAREMQKPYPELLDQIETVCKIVTLEEERFGETLDRGLGLFQTALAAAREAGKKEIPGEVVFRLYDTYGFPVDLTDLLAREAGMGLDYQGYDAAMNQQRERARAEQQSKKGGAVNDMALFDQYGVTNFIGYTQLSGSGTLVAVLDGQDKNGNISAILDQTVFYAESGGQVADHGEVRWADGWARVTDVQKAPGGVFVHKLRVEQGTLPVGGQLELKVDAARRARSAAHHTATHMLQAALREILGTHVRQSGSLVEPDRLRFDFSHFAGLTSHERSAVETRINQKIREDIVLKITEMSYDDAIAKGAMAFFGEKYGSIVRVVDIPGFSVELCGGTHVGSTGQIGAFLFDAEGSVSAGVRRVEALVAEAAIEKVRRLETELNTVAAKLNVPKKELLKKVDALLEALDTSEKELAKLRQKLAVDAAKDMDQQVEQLGPYRVLAASVSAANLGELRTLADRLREKLKDTVIALASPEGDQPSLLVLVPEVLHKELHAGDLLKKMAEVMGGRGGGKAGSAQGGGGDPAKIPAALAAFKDAVGKK